MKPTNVVLPSTALPSTAPSAKSQRLRELSLKPRTTKAGPNSQRQRALPSRDAIAWTIKDFQAMGGPSRTKIHYMSKSGELKTFIDQFGRRMVDGDSGRAMLSSIKEEEVS